MTDPTTIVQVQVVRRNRVVYAVAREGPDSKALREMEDELIRWGADRSELRTVAGQSARLFDIRFWPRHPLIQPE